MKGLEVTFLGGHKSFVLYVRCIVLFVTRSFLGKISRALNIFPSRMILMPINNLI